jgi:hypothetical protein
LQTLAKTANFCARFDKSYINGLLALRAENKKTAGLFFHHNEKTAFRRRIFTI